MKKSFVLLITLMLVLYLTGCVHVKTNSYSGTADIRMETCSNDKMARISIIDTYTKGGMKYYVFTTDISGSEKFTFSEVEYDKYIGLGNDAVDCTVYTLSYYANIFSYKYVLCPHLELYDEQSLLHMIGAIENVNAYEYNYGIFDRDIDTAIHLCDVYGTNFKYGSCKLSITDKSNQIDVSIKGNLYRYSFLGETAFTEEEMAHYGELLNTLNENLGVYCNNLING